MANDAGVGGGPNTNSCEEQSRDVNKNHDDVTDVEAAAPVTGGNSFIRIVRTIQVRGHALLLFRCCVFYSVPQHFGGCQQLRSLPWGPAEVFQGGSRT